MRSSITEAECELDIGHAPYRADRFHKYPIAEKPEPIDAGALAIHLAAMDAAAARPPRRPVTLAHPAIFGGDLLRALKLDPATARATRVILDCDMTKDAVVVTITSLVDGATREAVADVVKRFELREVTP